MNDKPHVERSVDPAMPESTRTIKGIEGLQDVPRSIIPVPFYVLVQPESSKVILPDGKRAPNGTFLMSDIRLTANELNFILLRAKRQTRIIDDEKVVSLNVLGYNLERKKPFILGVPVTSFGEFGKFFETLAERGASKAWEYPVLAEIEEMVDKKQTKQGIKDVTWYVIRLTVSAKKVDEELYQLGQELYWDFGEKLDRNEDDDDLAAIAGKVFTEPK